MTTIFVTTSRGLDELLNAEINALLPDVPTQTSQGAVSFDGTLEQAYIVCLWSRLANRVLWELNSGLVKNASDLYALSATIDWPSHFASSASFVVHFNGTNQVIKHSQFGAQTVKDGVVDSFIEQDENRPNVDKMSPDISLYARCRRDNVSVGIDLSGTSLHQRHYRKGQGEAPLKEHVAAAMLMRSGWASSLSKPLVDPMCGSGTIAIEAALMASNRAPGLNRTVWGFTKWLRHSELSWQRLLDKAKESIKLPEMRIYASDINRELIAIAKQNAHEAGVFSYIEFNVANALKLTVPDGLTQGYLVSNPPYGERLNDISDLLPTFQQWGITLKQYWPKWQLSLLTSHRDLLRALKLRASKEYSIMNGKLECRLVNFTLDEANLTVLHQDQAHPFSNRVKKNLKRLKSWINKQDTNCYRIYDADLPEYNVAIDKYDNFYVVQEYAPPKTIDENKAKRRLQDVLMHLPNALACKSEQVILKVRERQKGAAQYEKHSQTDRRIKVYENGALLWVNLWDYLDTGLFLDHRDTRQKVKALAKNKDVLNLFSYTGSVSVSAALGGARSVTTVDMSNTYIEWAKDNFALNKIKGPHRFVKADCLQWLSTHEGQYDIIFVDPPSFSNSKKMDTTWDVQRDHLSLLKQVASCLKPKGIILFSNNKRGFKLDDQGLNSAGLIAKDISKATIPEDFKRHSNIHYCWEITSAN